MGAHLDSFVATNSKLGYSRGTVRQRLWLLADLEQWLKRKGLVLVDLQEPVMKRFLERQRRTGRLKPVMHESCSTSSNTCVTRVLIQSFEPPIDVSPLTILRKRYENYLRKERGFLR